MRHLITGRRQTDRARRIVLVGTAAAALPVVTSATAVVLTKNPVVVGVAAIASTLAAAALVALLLTRLSRRIVRQRRHFDEERRRWRHEAHTDPLCRIANRRGAEARVAQWVATAGPSDRWTVLALDVDRFKEVNDLHGHPVGDRVLAMVADTLVDQVPPDALVARWGGDEFVVATLGPVGATERWARSITDAVAATPVRCREGELFVGTSHGLAVAPASVPFDDVLAAADRSLLAAKERMRRPVRLNAPESSDVISIVGRGRSSFEPAHAR